MTFSPVIVSTGLVGWNFLSKTLDRQIASYEESSEIQRSIDYFKANIGNIKTAEQLVSDRQLLQVALGAFDLSEDINNKFLITRILEEGGDNPNSLANRFSDVRYVELSKAFGFDNVRTNERIFPDFSDLITKKFIRKSFEVAVGNVDEALRLSMGLSGELERISKLDGSEASKWYSVLGNPPLKKVFTDALSLPVGFNSLDIDQQADEIRWRSQAFLGINSFFELTEIGNTDRLRDLFLLKSQSNEVNYAGSSAVALQILSSNFSVRL